MACTHVPIGQPLPEAAGKHALSVSLPTWSSHIGFKEDDRRVTDLMQTGYPRFWAHWDIRKLSKFLEDRYGKAGEKAHLLRSASAAQACCAFMSARNVSARVVKCDLPTKARPGADLHIVFYPEDGFGVAKEFWQHTGLGVTTRLTHYYMNLLLGDGCLAKIPGGAGTADLDNDDSRLTEAAIGAKLKIRRRIADLVQIDVENVFLYPAGMHAIWSAHQLCMQVLGESKSVCFGFPYVDTLKVLEKWGPGCYFFPDGADKFIDELEELMVSLKNGKSSAVSPILAIFTELPSNPLLRSVNFPRLRQLADKYEIPIVVDETVGNFANVDMMSYADIVVSSLSKLFSGQADVMGGSLILNPTGKHYSALMNQLCATYEDMYFDEDVIVMERNSRDFVQRSSIIDSNTDAVTAYLKSSDCAAVVKEVYYPKFQTRAHYDTCRRPNGGYGGLFSILFASVAAAQGFFDALPCPKGPSFGTNFTLVCPYAIIAHYRELDWAKSHGVPIELVRVWVGLEKFGDLMDAFRGAIKAAEEAHAHHAPGDMPQAIWRAASCSAGE